jgi:hypothetical protein
MSSTQPPSASLLDKEHADITYLK